MKAKITAKRLPQILIVDDEPDMRDLLKEVIGYIGCAPLEAEKATEALEQIEKFHIDLMLLDIQMQGASGIDLLKVLRRRQLNIPTIIISGYITEEMATQLAALRVRGIVAKPFTPTRIAQEIRKVLNLAPVSS